MQYKILKPTSCKALAKPVKLRFSQLKMISPLNASPPNLGAGCRTNEDSMDFLAVDDQISTSEIKNEIKSLKDKVSKVEKLLRSMENRQRRLVSNLTTSEQKTPRVKFHDTAVVCRIADDFTQELEQEADEEVNFMPKGKCKRPNRHKRAETEPEYYDFSWPDLDFWSSMPWIIDLEN